MYISSLQTKSFIKKINNGQFDQALQFANDISLKDPENPIGYAMLGDALKQKGELEKATSFYQVSLHKDPEQPGVNIALGESYVVIGETGKAYDAYYKALELMPENSIILQKVGGFLVTVGQYEEAKVLLEKSLSLGNQSAINNLLELFIYLGKESQIEHFVEKYKNVLNTQKDELSFTKAKFSLGQYEEVIKDLSALDIQKKNSVWKSGYFHLLASAYEKQGDLKQAFKVYQQQNEVNAPIYDAAIVEQKAQVLKQHFVGMKSLQIEESLKKFPAFNPMFIIGMPRSGTTLVEQVLNSSSHVVPGGELHFIEAAFRKCLNDEDSLENLAKWYREKIEFITINYPFPKTAPRWITDKMPTNFMYLGFIKKLLPDAQFVHCKRDLMDNGLSIYKQNFMQSHAYSNKFEDMAHFMSIEQQMMDYWNQCFPESIHTICYEDFVHDFENETKRLYEFSDLQWNSNVHQFYNNKTFSNTASKDQVRQPVHAKSIGYYKKFEEQLEPLKLALMKHNLL